LGGQKNLWGVKRLKGQTRLKRGGEDTSKMADQEQHTGGERKKEPKASRRVEVAKEGSVKSLTWNRYIKQEEGSESKPGGAEKIAQQVMRRKSKKKKKKGAK